MKRPLVWIAGVFTLSIVLPLLWQIQLGIVLAGAGLGLLYLLQLVQASYRKLVGAPALAPRPAPGGVPAYEQYFVRQAGRDLLAILGEWWRSCLRETLSIAGWIDRVFLFRYSRLVKLLGAVLLVAFAFSVMLGTVVAVWAAATAVLLVLGLYAATWTTMYVLRAIDTAMLWLRSITITCPACYHRVPYPSYRCEGCSTWHDDVRPGRYGIFRRACAGCAPGDGHSMPTLLLLGSHRMVARCPRCETLLADGSGSTTELVLPVFGAPDAGKTRLILTMMASLEQLAERHGAELELADEETRRRYRTLRSRMIASGGDPGKTNVAELPKAWSMYAYPDKGSKRLIHIFDAAGERFNQTERLQELRFMGLARTFLFVLDPLCIESFWTGLTSEERRRLGRMRRGVHPPDLSFQQTLHNVEAMGVVTSRARLLVAISKADLLDGMTGFPSLGIRGEQLETWLDDELGLGNLLRSMRHSFLEIRFFATAACIDTEGSVDDSVPPLLDWILNGDRRRSPR